jgi:hypothetical protein
VVDAGIHAEDVLRDGKERRVAQLSGRKFPQPPLVFRAPKNDDFLGSSLPLPTKLFISS